MDSLSLRRIVEIKTSEQMKENYKQIFIETNHWNSLCRMEGNLGVLCMIDYANQSYWLVAIANIIEWVTNTHWLVTGQYKLVFFKWRHHQTNILVVTSSHTSSTSAVEAADELIELDGEDAGLVLRCRFKHRMLLSSVVMWKLTLMPNDFKSLRKKRGKLKTLLDSVYIVSAETLQRVWGKISMCTYS